MDIVLEVCDYFLFDRLYASALPKGGKVDQFIHNSPLIQQVSSTVSQFLPASVANSANAYDTLDKAILGNASSSASSALNFQFNSTSVNVANLPLYLFSKIMSLQNKSEIYGLKPTFLPAGDYFSSSILSRSNLLRESLSILVVTTIFGWLLYLIVAYFSYLFVFDRRIFNHPRYLKNQMWLEIERAMTAIPIMVALTNPFFLLELKGFSRLYLDINENTGGWKFIVLQIPMFILFTDCLIYFIHRWLHWPSVYKKLHKPHHKWIVCTPFASHAFHPVDGWAQSLPYHLYPLLFPLHKVLYLGLFTFVNFWTVMIHDGNYMSNDPVVNGTACHTVHHLYFNYNYGQFTTLWDRIGRSYRRPDDSFFIKDTNTEKEKQEWKKQVMQMEEIRNELEGKVDDREYVEES
ncbi:ERG3 [Candida margitis]|uniref:ERG3 n=1 Tax=Candida margitis TaxID=1775924 RepID=UPI0022280CA7|nr:ERG3 [Candida margitis]KAI5969525.1 ERG3 [Candida margitis]